MTYPSTRARAHDPYLESLKALRAHTASRSEHLTNEIIDRLLAPSRTRAWRLRRLGRASATAGAALGGLGILATWVGGKAVAAGAVLAASCLALSFFAGIVFWRCSRAFDAYLTHRNEVEREYRLPLSSDQLLRARAMLASHPGLLDVLDGWSRAGIPLRRVELSLAKHAGEVYRSQAVADMAHG